MTNAVFPLAGQDHAHWTWCCPPPAEGGCGYRTIWTFPTEADALHDYTIHTRRHTPPTTHPDNQADRNQPLLLCGTTDLEPGDLTNPHPITIPPHQENPMRTVITLSGGLDSTVLATYLKARGHTLRAVSFSYGQRHETAELMAARNVAAHLDIPHRVLSLTGVTSAMNPDSSQLLATNPAEAVPEGHYTGENMKVTAVPGRNLLMIAAATAYADSYDYDAIALAAHSGDHPIYPDCRPDFLVPTAQATAAGYGVHLVFPFAEDTKAEIATRGHALDAPMHLTWSCYNGGEIHCGKCGTCVERIEAFMEASVNDPTEYANTEFAKQVIKTS